MHDVSIIGGVECYEQGGVAYLKLETVAKGLGFTQEKNGVEYIRWETVNGFLASLGFPNKLGKDDFIPENIFYRLAMKAKNEAAEAFQAKVADEIIPSIRKTGSYSVVNRESLSPTLQMLYMLADNSAAMEMEQKKQAEQIKALDTTVSTMKEIMTEPLGDWKSDIKKRVVRIAQALNKDYKDVYSEMYGQLEVEARISLSRRCDSKKARMEKAGNTKAAIKEGATKLAIIYDDQKLRIIFENIVKKWAMRYCA